MPVQAGHSRPITSRCIAQRHRDVALPAFVADAADGRAGQAGVELVGGPVHQINQTRRIQAVAGREIRLAGGMRELVPRAHQLAVVATVDAVADERAQRLGNAALEFDGEVGNAAPRIELVGPEDRPRRTDLDAALTGSAVVFFFLKYILRVYPNSKEKGEGPC